MYKELVSVLIPRRLWIIATPIFSHTLQLEVHGHVQTVSNGVAPLQMKNEVFTLFVLVVVTNLGADADHDTVIRQCM